MEKRTYFLERIAKHLYEEYGQNLKSQCLVFPGRRAGLYFVKYLAGMIEKPVWSPAVMTINDFFSEFSSLQVAENEILLFELYKSYRKLNSQAESFDDFYFWGDMLISDFNDIDKYLADPAIIFRNIKDYRNIDSQFGDLDPEQAQTIKKFWMNFEPEKSTPQKKEFREIWSILYDLYSDFRNSLRASGIAYEGMIARDAAVKFHATGTPPIKWGQIHFIGFNALNNCEKTLMKRLQNEGLARFYWDFDNSYIRKGKLNSAGLFMTGNLKDFKNDMPGDWEYDTLLSSEGSLPERKVIETTSDIAQVKLVPYLLSETEGITPENAHHTAIIPADENLLVPLITSLPENNGDINITMGFPLKMSGVYTIVRHILDYQQNLITENGAVYSGYRPVLAILKHHLIEELLNEADRKIQDEIIKNNLSRVSCDFLCTTERMKAIFSPASDPGQLSDYLRNILLLISLAHLKKDDLPNGKDREIDLRNEFIYRVMLSVNRLDKISRTQEISLKTGTFIRILDKILRSQSVPFSGEPLSGIQIMGILETRALDFRNIIMLSVNEGTLPRISAGSSFIPYSIREAFGLPSINHQESIYAYHFYRLLHRAENVTFIFNSQTDGLNTGEMSRFLLQMKYEHILDRPVQTTRFDIRTPTSVSQVLTRTDLHSERLCSIFLDGGNKVTMSPTAINTWLNCRMKFYYSYVSGLKEPEVITPEIDHAIFGQILHRLMRNVYVSYKGTEIGPGIIDSLLKDENGLRNLIDKSVNECYNSNTQRPESGNDLIIKDILYLYLQRIFNIDRDIAPFTILDLESSFEFNLEFELNGVKRKLRTGGKMDRVDQKAGKTRIVDYKTGEIARKINSINDLFGDDRDKKLDGWLQTLLYCEAYRSENKNSNIKPSIYRIKDRIKEKSTDTLLLIPGRGTEIPVEDYGEVRSEFLKGLEELIITIFDPEEPFRMTEKTLKCFYCPYRELCQR
ncbi:MAG: PD-(D/E)XK nuclease family protein [Bacteroidota bacterium]|nr:PD-(D/E)XK nuclease family protein [Bacteroidota bacterium]